MTAPLACDQPRIPQCHSLPKFCPSFIRTCDFFEACTVLADSAKASAALSRRCLQAILKDKLGAKKKDLNDQIDEVIAPGTIPAHIAEGLHAVRNIGNFAAHPIKSTSTPSIVDVEPGEAEWNLEVIKMLFDQMDTVIQQRAREDEACQRLTTIPGVGPVTATALIAAIGNGTAFRKGRGLAAWIGMVPREHSTGGKQRLLGISKRGNAYLRTLFVQGARSVVQQRHKQSPGLSQRSAQLLGRTHQNVVIVALANKLVRMAWAVLCKNERYRAPVLAVTT